jgi:hypothetical protein
MFEGWSWVQERSGAVLFEVRDHDVVIVLAKLRNLVK